MAVPLLDLKRQYVAIKDELDEAVHRVLDHCWFVLGPEVKELEGKIAAYCSTKFASGVASGTDALLLSLRAAGVKAGDEVITSDYSFFASAGVIARLGAKPVFVDIEPDTYNIDPAQAEAAVTPRTKAMMPVHLFGQTADMDPLMDIARKHNLAVIEDAAQAIGAEYNGRRAGAIGDFGCFSFYPSKNLGANGDGGMVVTDTAENDEMIRMLRLHGWKEKYRPLVVGYNSRLDTLQAAILLVKLKYLDDWSKRRREHADKYNAAFAGIGITTPTVREYAYHIYNQYTIEVGNRDELLKTLKEKQIGHDIYYPQPFHLMKCFEDLGHKEGEFPATERAASRAVSIPIFPEMTAAEQEEVIDVVKAVAG